MRIRVREPNGQHVLDVDDGATVSQLKASIQGATGIEVAVQELRFGFPTKLVECENDEETTCEAMGIRGGETLTISQRVMVSVAVVDEPGSGSGATSTYASLMSMDEDEALARALAASMEDGHAGAGSDAVGPTKDPCDMCAMRRVIKSDNSCLFNAVGYGVERTLTKASELRAAIVTAIKADPETFNEGFLGKPRDEYVSWITRTNSWGGQVELFILSKHYGVEIAAYDIQTERCDIYGQNEGYTTRIAVIYDGLHYDALTLNPCSKGSRPEDDVTHLPPSDDPRCNVVDLKMRALVREQHLARSFTDTANFSLRCLVCQKGLKGESEAVSHAKETGHANFGEY